jgi:hypothetical protein
MPSLPRDEPVCEARQSAIEQRDKASARRNLERQHA